MKKPTLLFMLALFALATATAWAQEAQTGPLNPKFIEWQANKSQGAENLGLIPSPVLWPRSPESAAKAAPPASFDLRTVQNGLTPVKNQNPCGACWAFASCSAIESWARYKNGQTLDLSENNLKNHHGFNIDPCSGGNDDMATAYFARGAGPLSEADDPYNGSNVTQPVAGAKPVLYIKAAPVFTLGTSGDRTEIQNAIMTYGALYISMLWSDGAYNGTTKTYYYHGTTPAQGGHAVAVVGWDNNKAVPGAPGAGAWICKNNWDTYWGESGYFYISYYDTDAAQQARAFINQAAPSTYSRIYQHDTLGMTSYGTFNDSATCYGANVFTAAADGRIKAVATWVTAHNTSYQVTVYNSGYANGFSNPVATVSGTAAQPGYITVDLPSEIAITAGQKFTVAVRYTIPQTAMAEVYPLPLERPVSAEYPATAATGQSYVSLDGTGWSDMQNYWANGNACIKALVSETAPPVEVLVYGPGMVQVGDALNFRAHVKNGVGTVTYQWRHNHTDIDGATAAVFVIPFANTYNSGTYTVAITDGSKATYESAPFHVNVLPEDSLPLAGTAGIVLLAAALGAAGAARRRR